VDQNIEIGKWTIQQESMGLQDLKFAILTQQFGGQCLPSETQDHKAYML
jgi:hypothetical protein